MKYKDYEITIDPDYVGMVQAGAECQEYYCYVYRADDTLYENCLCEFNMMPSFEFEEHTVESIEAGIKKMVDEAYDNIQLSICEEQLKRKNDLLGRMLCYIGEWESGEELYNTLQEYVGMTDEEIAEMGFDSLKEFFGQESEPDITLS